MSKLPRSFVEFKRQYEDVFKCYEALGNAVRDAGPLSQREVALVRLATASGAGLEGAVHAHCRRALEAGLSPEDIRHAVILGVTTLGFPSMMANLSRANDVLNEENGGAG